MAAIPRETIMTTLALLGIGFVIVIALLIFAFSILNTSNSNNGNSLPTGSPGSYYETPTPEYVPNQPYLEDTTPTPPAATPTSAQVFPQFGL